MQQSFQVYVAASRLVNDTRLHGNVSDASDIIRGEFSTTNNPVMRPYSVSTAYRRIQVKTVGPTCNVAVSQAILPVVYLKFQ